MSESSSLKELIVCPACQGSGLVGGRRCKECGGAGVAKLIGGRFYYWQDSMLLPWVYLARLKRVFEWLLEFSLFLFGFVGLIAASWHLHLDYNLLSDGLTFEGLSALFLERNELLLLFWSSLLGDMYFAYRLSEHKASKQGIKRLPEIEVEPEVMASIHKIFKGRRRHRVDIIESFSHKMLVSLESSVLLANRFGHQTVDAHHLLRAILDDSEFSALLFRLEMPAVALRSKLDAYLAAMPRSGRGARFSPILRKVLVEGYALALSLDEEKVRPVHFLMPILSLDEKLHEIFYAFDVEEPDVAKAVEWFALSARLASQYRRFLQLASLKPGGNMNRAYTAQATPLLNAYGRDLTYLARQQMLDFCIGREAELGQIFKEFRSGKAGVVLVGEVGVGKYAIVSGLAQLMVEELVPEYLQDKRLVELDVSRLIAGASPALAQERLQQLLDEVVRSGNIVIFINNIETISGISSGNEQSLDLADVLISHLERYRTNCLVSVTRENYIKYVESQPIGQAFAKVEVNEPNDRQALAVIEAKAGYFESVHRVFFTYHSLEAIIELSKRFIHYKYLPAKGIDILEALSLAHAGRRGHYSLITKEEVAEVVSRETGVPVARAGYEEREGLLNLEARIHEHMIDQEEAVNAVAAALRRARAQLNEGQRPIASFLFLGPTGVGKTELAKAITKVYFGNPKYMVRLDMSEYQTQSMITKMIGDGDKEKGYLTEAVRQNPFSLVLLDEFEKAHPDIFNLFLQVMDDGRLTDGHGRTIDFTNCIIIATSNAGASFIQQAIAEKKNIEEIRSTLVEEHLVKVMRPELINRFDGLIVFKPLGEAEVIQIAKLLFSRIGSNLEAKGIHLEVKEEGLKYFAHAGFDPKFGARPLRRVLQDRVENEIANKLLSGELSRRDTLVVGEGVLEVLKAQEI